MEATVVCVDNSEWTRNGDFAPTRFEAQSDAVNLLAGAKTQANPENTVGVLTMAGKSPRVLVTPTPDLGKILSSMHGLDIEGESNLSAAVQIAQLALKHRQNKNQRQRIVIFQGSPIKEDKDKLVKIAKKLKKNNVAVDVVSFGCEEENAEALEAFHEAVNSNDNSHLVTVPTGTVLSDSLFGSPIFQAEGGGYGGGAAEGGEAREGYEFGVDPNLDPELALALRVSLEEERARQNAAAAAAANEGEQGAAAGEEAAPAGAAPAAAGSEAEPMDEDALLQEALAMSMQEAIVGAEGPPTAQAAAAPAADAPMFDGGEDEELQRALAMSVTDTGEQQAETPSTAAQGFNADYMRSVVSSLPGVDINNPEVQASLQRVQNASQINEAKKPGEEAQKDGKERK